MAVVGYGDVVDITGVEGGIEVAERSASAVRFEPRGTDDVAVSGEVEGKEGFRPCSGIDEIEPPGNSYASAHRSRCAGVGA